MIQSPTLLLHINVTYEWVVISGVCYFRQNQRMACMRLYYKLGNFMYLSSNNKIALLFILCIFTLSISSCRSSKQDSEELLLLPAETLYNVGLQHAQNGDNSAIDELDALIAAYPFSPHIEDVYLLKIYTHFIHNNFDNALASIKNYELFYPTSPNMPYVAYMKSISYHSQLDSMRVDQGTAYKALQAFYNVMYFYPDSAYAVDVVDKYRQTLNLLAMQEMIIGRFYMKQNNMIAAMGRFKSVLDLYDESIFIPEALYRLVAAYSRLGVTSQAHAYAEVLDANFSDTQWNSKAKDILAILGNNSDK